ncbi:hypothetical protein ERO13_A01G142301v2 [Gossypium hirsutum]|nr:hypothetical protein ERO13_A01G142301v2 [Gossypium hirsutum]
MTVLLMAAIPPCLSPPTPSTNRSATLTLICQLLEMPSTLLLVSRLLLSLNALALFPASARDLVVMVGGPFYEVVLGRKDSRKSNLSIVDKNLPKALTPMNELLSLFSSKGFSADEMVALVGAHTIGFSHCKEFANRIFNFSKTSEFDPAYNPVFAQGLRKLCANYTKSPAMSAFNDVHTPGKFDNMYYKNLQNGLGLLSSDQEMVTDNRTKPFVDRFAANETAFFDMFARSMEKLSVYKVKENNDGDVRRRCDQFNTLQV